MSLVTLLAGALAVSQADTVRPYLSFPEPGLDDPAAYAGYRTRFYRDARGNAVQIYLDSKSGRVVHLWADALDESIGLTARDSDGTPAAVTWGAQDAVVSGAGGRRWLRYSLTVQGGRSTNIGLFLLGSMRVERDLQYAGRQQGALDAAPFVPAELVELVAKVDRLPAAERRRALALLGARDVATLRARLEPSLTVEQTATTWRVRVAQPSLDGKHHLTMILRGDARATTVTPRGSVVRIRPRSSMRRGGTTT